MSNFVKIILALALAVSLLTLGACADNGNVEDESYTGGELTSDSESESENNIEDDSESDTEGDTETESDTERHFGGIQQF